ncbi:MAG: hypothetical protein R3325_01830 [Thermoanaerobaculia bacterium]|nr:hypothetical protein [Thermoanaerobaculia bacterium]
MSGKTKSGGGGAGKEGGGTAATPVILALDSATAQVINTGLVDGLRVVSNGQITMTLPEQTALIFQTALAAGIQASESGSGENSGKKGGDPGGGDPGGSRGGGKSGGK